MSPVPTLWGEKPVLSLKAQEGNYSNLGQTLLRA